MEVGRLPDLFAGISCYVHKRDLQGDGSGALVHAPRANSESGFIPHPFITLLIQPRSTASLPGSTPLEYMSTPICDYYVSVGTAPKYVTGENTVELLWATAKQIGFHRIGFSPYNIGSHSLRLGGAMTLHQAHILDSNIKIIGRWRSDAFLIYLQG